MKESHKRSRNPAYKKKYRVTNWSEYEKSLRNRGNLTLWLSPSALKSWKATRSGKSGRQQKYSDLAIEKVLTLRLLFQRPLRQNEGFIESLFRSFSRSRPHNTVPQEQNIKAHFGSSPATPKNLFISSWIYGFIRPRRRSLVKWKEAEERMEKATYHD